MEKEIDLRPHIIAVLGQWRLIAIIAIAAAVIAALIAFSLPTAFTATSDVLILPSRSQLTFDPRFVTNNATLGTDAVSRRQALVALASSAALEAQVLSKIPADLVGENYRPGDLAQRLRVSSDGDLLHIETSALSAQTAQALAETWAQAYVHTVNNLYGRDNIMLHEVESQLADAQTRYDQAQHNLETFIGTSTIVRVQQQISTTTELLNGSLAGTQKLYAQYLEQARTLEGTLRDAETVRQQVAAGQAEGLANALAALSLRARAAGSVQLPIDLRFDDPSAFASNGVTLADLDALINVLQQRRDVLVEQSHQLAQTISDGKGAGGSLPPTLQDTYEKRLSVLYQQYEQQTSQAKLLQQRRDLAFESLSILQRKLDEQRVALGTPEVQLRFISVGVEPPRGWLSRAILFGSAAAVAGVCLSGLIVLGLSIVQPGLAQWRTQKGGERPLDQPTPS
jgi:capsular polysaccharide biosynthesis protein